MGAPPSESSDSAWGGGQDGVLLDSLTESTLQKWRKRIETALFGTVYMLVKENDIYYRFTFISMIIEYIQLLAFALQTKVHPLFWPVVEGVVGVCMVPAKPVACARAPSVSALRSRGNVDRRCGCSQFPWGEVTGYPVFYYLQQVQLLAYSWGEQGYNITFWASVGLTVAMIINASFVSFNFMVRVRECFACSLSLCRSSSCCLCPSPAARSDRVPTVSSAVPHRESTDSLVCALR